MYTRRAASQRQTGMLLAAVSSTSIVRPSASSITSKIAHTTSLRICHPVAPPSRVYTDQSALLALGCWMMLVLLAAAASHTLVAVPVAVRAPHRPQLAHRSQLIVPGTSDAARSRSQPLTMRSTKTAGPATQPSPTAVLGACFAVSVATGSFYCWSLMLPMLQASLGCARAPLSAVFSLSTVCFTCGTSLGAQLLPLLPGPMTAILMIGSGIATGLIAASCHAIPAAKSTGLLVLALGWSLGFGTMSGLACAPSGPTPSCSTPSRPAPAHLPLPRTAHRAPRTARRAPRTAHRAPRTARSALADALNVKISNSEMFKGRNGFATGLLVSGRAGAAPLVSPFVQAALAAGGPPAALRALALFVWCMLLPAALTLRGLTWAALEQPAAKAVAKGAGAAAAVAKGAGAAAAAAAAGDGTAVLAPLPRMRSRFEATGAPGRRVTALLWLALLCGSGPGLLCHGHAAALLQSAGAASGAAGVAGAAPGALGRLGVSMMALGSICGRLGGGLLIDTVSCRSCLVVAPCLAAALVAAPLALPASVPLTAAALLGCGLTYGLNAVVRHPRLHMVTASITYGHSAEADAVVRHPPPGPLPAACPYPNPRPRTEPDALHPICTPALPVPLRLCVAALWPRAPLGGLRQGLHGVGRGGRARAVARRPALRRDRRVRRGTRRLGDGLRYRRAYRPRTALRPRPRRERRLTKRRSE